ncbi:helix-turn-helix domain-containing protein [Alsobacter sp. SYSU M60028]|uniref:Helix-turn-helix domain-containing protein n=1 Tax=Alsobacter ponti TaxID=2962936 RepID=A0ABT1LI72_9HYPH|nr:helix-turn-helix domain-containing protein [Alsobacter ponti]
MAGISAAMVGKIESGASAGSFETIERLAKALKVEPAELFSTHVIGSQVTEGPYKEINKKLAQLQPDELVWLSTVVSLVLAKPDSQRRGDAKFEWSSTTQNLRKLKKPKET